MIVMNLTGYAGTNPIFFPAKHAKNAKNTISYTIKLGGIRRNFRIAPKR